jgi:hypothetical protein
MKYLGIRRPEVSLTLAPADIQYDNLIDLENIEKLDEMVINNSNLSRVHMIAHAIIGNKKQEFSDLLYRSYKKNHAR